MLEMHRTLRCHELNTTATRNITIEVIVERIAGVQKHPKKTVILIPFVKRTRLVVQTILLVDIGEKVKLRCRRKFYENLTYK